MTQPKPKLTLKDLTPTERHIVETWKNGGMTEKEAIERLRRPMMFTWNATDGLSRARI